MLPFSARASVFEQTFENFHDILHEAASCTSALGCPERSPWLLAFSEVPDALEQGKAAESEWQGGRAEVMALIRGLV